MAIVKPMPCRDNANNGTNAIRDFSDPRCLAEGVGERLIVSGAIVPNFNLSSCVSRQDLNNILFSFPYASNWTANTPIDLSVRDEYEYPSDIVGNLVREDIFIDNNISTEETIRQFFREIDKYRTLILRDGLKYDVNGFIHTIENGEDTKGSLQNLDLSAFATRVIDKTSNEEQYLEYSSVNISQLLSIDATQDRNKIPRIKSVKTIFVITVWDRYNEVSTFKSVPIAFELTDDKDFIPYEENGKYYYARYFMSCFSEMKSSLNIATQILAKAGYPTFLYEAEDGRYVSIFGCEFFSLVDFDFQILPSKWGWQYIPNQP